MQFKIIFLFLITFLFTQKSFAKIGQVHGFVNANYLVADEEVVYDTTITDKPSMIEHSSAGINLSIDIDNNISGFVQILGTQTADEAVVEFDVAQIKLDWGNKTNIRVGKSRTFSWMISEYRYVGALYPWVSLPTEAYSLNPVDSHNGISLSHRFDFNQDYSLTFDLNFGESQYKVVGDYVTEDVKITDIRGLQMELLFPKGKLRAAKGLAETDGNYIFQTESSTANNYLTVTRPYLSGTAEFSTVGLRLDLSDWLIMSEWTALKTLDEDLIDKEAYYITLGYYLLDRKHLIHLTHGETTKNVYDEGRDKSLTIGYNYNFSFSLVGKLDYKMVEHTEEGASNFDTTFTGLDDVPEKTNIIGASLSLVF
ncbi:MAG: hypothetical protein VYA54_06320 [Bdellovibrionota bacterium]|nr:hypothetical protein [Bdellovibrionota bacterium]